MADQIAVADERRWSWWAGAGASPETYTVNEATRDAVIAAGRDEFEGELFTIVCATQDGAFACTPFDDEALVEQVIERFADDNAERFGEDGFDGDIDQQALAAALNAAFAAFMDQHAHAVRVWSFTGQRDREEVRP